MATYSRILTWGISWTEEPGVLRSVALHRVGHNLATEHTHSDRCRGRAEGETVEHRHSRCTFPNPPLGMIFLPVILGVEIC